MAVLEAPDPVLDEDERPWCPEPDCDRGPGMGGKPFTSLASYKAHYQRHNNDRRRVAEAEERRLAAERGDVVDPSGARKSHSGKVAPLNDRMAASLAAIGAGANITPLFPVSVRADGASLVNHARPLANAAADLAAENETVRKACELIAGGGAWGAFLFAFYFFGLEVAANHGWIKAAPGPVAPVGPVASFDPMSMMAQMAESMGTTPEAMMAQAAAMFGQMGTPQAGGRPPLRPEGVEPGLDGAGEVRVA